MSSVQPDGEKALDKQLYSPYNIDRWLLRKSSISDWLCCVDKETNSYEFPFLLSPQFSRDRNLHSHTIHSTSLAREHLLHRLNENYAKICGV